LFITKDKLDELVEARSLMYESYQTISVMEDLRTVCLPLLSY